MILNLYRAQSIIQDIVPTEREFRNGLCPVGRDLKINHPNLCKIWNEILNAQKIVWLFLVHTKDIWEVFWRIYRSLSGRRNRGGDIKWHGALWNLRLEYQSRMCCPVPRDKSSRKGRMPHQRHGLFLHTIRFAFWVKTTLIEVYTTDKKE